MALFLYYSNQLERLAQEYQLQVYGSRTGYPAAGLSLEPETILVQTRGIATYLQQFLAERTPIAANLEFPFPGGYLNMTLRKLFGKACAEAMNNADPGRMQWQIFSRFLLHPERYCEIKPYLFGTGRTTPDPQKAWQLAGQISALFDEYLLYRFDDPEAIFRKKSVKNTAKVLFETQKKLLTELRAEGAAPDEYLRKFLQLEQLPDSIQLPRRISVFGVSSMAAGHLAFLLKLAQFCDVHFFYLNICCEYWANQYSPRELSRILEAGELPEPGNPLLGALGTQGRNFFRLLNELAGNEVQETECFQDFVSSGNPSDPDGYGAGTTRLQALQQDIFHLFDRRRKSPEANSRVQFDLFSADANAEFSGSPLAFPPEDDSISCHNCHSVRREVEVLHDRLLDLLQHHNGKLENRDILVMAPDIRKYRNAIRAIFDAGPLRNVYRIADSTLDNDSPRLQTLLQLLQLHESRFSAPDLAECLNNPILSQYFGISETDLAQATHLLEATGFRWGFDADEHETRCGVAFEEYTFRRSEEILLHQYMTGLGGVRRDGIQPSRFSDAPNDADSASQESDASRPIFLSDVAVPSGQGELLGKICQFFETLQTLRTTFRTPHTLSQWSEILLELIDRFLAGDRSSEAAAECAVLRAGTLALLDAEREMHLEHARLDLGALRMIYCDQLEKVSSNTGFLDGRITFCTMTPMRSIPMRTIAILGLSDGEFPRTDRSCEFNLLTLPGIPPRRGDRSRNQEERYLFLEAILAARENLLLFYSGQSSTGSEVKPPCIPLLEVLDYLQKMGDFQEIRHPLQNFSSSLFDGVRPELFSYREAACRWAEILRQSQGAISNAPPQLQWPAPEQPEPCVIPQFAPGTLLELATLVRFFSNPARAFLEQRLGGSLFQADSLELPESEPFELDMLDRANLRTLTATEFLNGVPLSTLQKSLQISNRIGVQAFAEQWFHDQETLCQQIPEKFRTAWFESETLLDVIDLESEPGAFRLAGNVPLFSRTRHEITRLRSGVFRHKFLVEAALSQLFCAIATEHPVTAELFAYDKQTFQSCRLLPVTPEVARKRFQKLLQWYYRGLTRPLALTPQGMVAAAFSTADCWEKRQALVLKNFRTKFSDCDAEQPGIRELQFEQRQNTPTYWKEFAQLGDLLYASVEGYRSMSEALRNASENDSGEEEASHA